MYKFNFKIYNFIMYGKVVFCISTFLCVILCSVIIMKGFNWGLDFTGGIVVEIVTEQDLDIIKIRNSFMKSDFKSSTVQYLSNSKNLIIRLPVISKSIDFDQQIKVNILDILTANIDQKFDIQQMLWIDPSTNKNLIKINAFAILMALLCILIYLTFRFELKLAIGAIISLIHDIIIILGILSAFSIEINLTIIAALISAIGYSLNDNVVIFDRIRENCSCLFKLSLCEIFNISLSQVLNRTIITSVTTAMVLLILLIFGGTMLREFSITLLIGVIVGTISSIYIASVLAFYLKVKYKNHFFI